MDDPEFIAIIGLWLIFTSPNKPKTPIWCCLNLNNSFVPSKVMYNPKVAKNITSKKKRNLVLLPPICLFKHVWSSDPIQPILLFGAHLKPCPLPLEKTRQKPWGSGRRRGARLLQEVSRLLPRRYPSPNPKLFDQPATANPSNPWKGWNFCLVICWGWTKCPKNNSIFCLTNSQIDCQTWCFCKSI